MLGLWKATAQAISGLFGEEQEEYEFSNDPQLDAENTKLLAQFKMLNAKLGSAPQGMTAAQYSAMLRKEGSGR